MEANNLQQVARRLAGYADKVGDLFADDCVICTNPSAQVEPGDITVGDLRRLRAALAELSANKAIDQ